MGIGQTIRPGSRLPWSRGSGVLPAVLPLADIHRMFEEMRDAQKDLLAWMN